MEDSARPPLRPQEPGPRTGRSCMLRLDPWAAAYDGSIQVADDDEGADVDVTVESLTWVAIVPPSAARPRLVAFVDGVRRVEHRLLVSDGERTVFGLLGSYGVGAAIVGAAAKVAHESIGRVAVVAGGLVIAPFSATLRTGAGAITFEPRTEAPNTPVAPVAGLQTAMREAEGRLAGRLAAEVEVVFQDGPLSFLTSGVSGQVVGFVKRLQRQYLDPARHALLPGLGVGGPAVTPPGTVASDPASGRPAASAQAAPERTRMRLVVEHPFENGRLIVWIDGVLVYETKLQAESSRRIVAIKVLEGRIEKRFDVTPGRHEVRVEVTWDDQHSVGSRVVDVAPAATGLLEVRVSRLTKDLTLEWSRLAD